MRNIEDKSSDWLPVYGEAYLVISELRMVSNMNS